MNDIHITNAPFPLDQSLCGYCKHRMSIVLVPINPETFGIDDNMKEAMDIPEDEGVQMEQHTCLVSHQDMDFVVIACNHFKARNDTDLLKSEPY